MSFFTKIGKFFGGSAAAVAESSATKSRSVARDRLSVILASQRGSELLEGVDMELLQRDVMEVVQVRDLWNASVLSHSQLKTIALVYSLTTGNLNHQLQSHFFVRTSVMDLTFYWPVIFSLSEMCRKNTVLLRTLLKQNALHRRE
uniref:Uncharacterized protein n=1 Tax=Ditylum brightwellii TaxID=49249 RepID=A0A6V2MVC0_9STRA|mmetsp:Transcript_1272/g.1528  ORF Transcript_1272/g.1528 Transcript_1272/m.1528 type:complete len:145 (+) Transcript_1272:283-717(+)